MKHMKHGLEGNGEMTDESSGASNTPAHQRAESPGLAAEREALWEASALSPADSAPEVDLSPGVRAALEQIFPAEEPRLGRVAERGVVYDTGATGGADEGIEALAGRYGMTLETLA